MVGKISEFFCAIITMYIQSAVDLNNEFRGLKVGIKIAKKLRRNLISDHLFGHKYRMFYLK